MEHCTFTIAVVLRRKMVKIKDVFVSKKKKSNFYIIGELQWLIVILISCSLWNIKPTHLVSEFIHSWVVICISILVVELLLWISIWVIVVDVVILLVSQLLNLSSLQDLILVELINLLSTRLITRVSLIIVITVSVMIPIFLFPCFGVVESLCVISGCLI